MKIAINNAFYGETFAETELIKRLCIAAKNLGWEAIEVATSSEINQFKPDFVLAVHFKTSKIAGFPTYGCMWNPPDFFEQYEHYIKQEKVKANILSYDGYLSSSSQINTWLKDTLYATNKKSFITPFYTSCHQVTYQKPNLENPHLVYVGTNWDGLRFKELFQYLDTKEYMEIYGSKDAWKYLNQAYKGPIPFDGVSVLNVLNQAGLGLCLHKEEHCKAAVPSMRIFEIAASGAVGICEEHPFIKEAFGDSVFYVDSQLSPLEKVIQISRYVRWIQNNQQEAIEMSALAHQIFMEKYSLENLLLSLVPHHEKLVREKGFVTSLDDNKTNNKRVEIIVRTGDREEETIKRCLDSIASQVYSNIGVIIVNYKKLEYLDALIKKYEGKFPIKVIRSQISGFRSTQITEGLNAVSSEYFGILDDDDLIHPNHVYSLVSLLEKFEDAGVAYSGSIRVWEEGKSEVNKGNRLELAREETELAYFEPFDINKILNLDNFITSNSFIARTSLLDEECKNDPELKVAEDTFLLLNFCRKTKFIFSYEATCEFYWRYSKKDNSTFETEQNWNESSKRLKNMFWKKQLFSSKHIFPNAEINSGYNYQSLDAQQLQIQQLQIQLEHNIAIIKAIQSSKFWKLRNILFRIKKALRIPTKEQVI